MRAIKERKIAKGIQKAKSHTSYRTEQEIQMIKRIEDIK